MPCMESGFARDYIMEKETFENAREKTFWTREARCPYSLDELNHMIRQADDKLESLKAARNQYGKQLEDLQEQLDLRDEKALELEELLQLQEEEINKYRLLKMTQEYLQKAKEQNKEKKIAQKSFNFISFSLFI